MDTEIDLKELINKTILYSYLGENGKNTGVYVGTVIALSPNKKVINILDIDCDNNYWYRISDLIVEDVLDEKSNS